MRTQYKTISFLLIMLSLFSCNKEHTFDDYFETSTLRIDYLLEGNSETEDFKLQELKKINYWAGTMKLASSKPLNMGNYRVNVFDSITERLIFQKGFCSLFQEWQATPQAKDTTVSYHHVNLVPFPKQTIRYTLEKRQFNDGKFIPIKSFYINPQSINNKAIVKNNTITIQKLGEPSKMIDLVFIAEGYMADEMTKFELDVNRIWNYMLSIPPYDKNKNHFNVTAIKSVSKESGTDEPNLNSYKETCINSHFGTFGVDRYLTTRDLKSMHDIAEIVPYDHIIVLVNTARYGGGGFYNYYSLCTSDHELSEKVAIHEFGHGFAGLADEYYSSDVASENLYNLSVEPWEKNITTMVDFDSKWKDMLSDNTPIPTPRDSIYMDSIGVFEGGGYNKEGIYSPVQDCRMKSNIPEGFCPVCSRATQEIIDSYIK